jgi:urease
LQQLTDNLKLIRDGNHTVADLMSIGATMLGRRHVLPSVSSTLTEIMVEGTFPTGTYLVTVHHPISSDDGDLAKALYGSFLPIPDKEIFPLPQKEEYEPTKQPGAVVTVKGKIVLNEGRKRIKLKVTSKGDRPIQVRPFTTQGEDANHGRSALITTSSRQIPNSNSIASNHMATV